MIAPRMPSEPGTITTLTIDIVPGQKAFSLFTRRSAKTNRPRIQAKTKNLSLLLAKDEILVNVVSPGSIASKSLVGWAKSVGVDGDDPY
jgi:hypothetical protein